MKEIVSLLVISWIIVITLFALLISVLIYYNKSVNYHKCKYACMQNCMNCRRNCDMRNKSVAIEERYKNTEISVMTNEI